MIQWHKLIICLFLGMISIQAFATNTDTSYAAQEVVIPGYSPPESTSATNSAAMMPDAPQANKSSNAPNTSGRISPEQGQKSCKRFIPITMPIEVVQANAKKMNLDDAQTATIYSWKRDGEPDLVITFSEDNTPISVQGNLPTTLGSASDLRFSLADVQKFLSTQGEIMGHVYIYSKGEGQLKIYTDPNNKVTRFTSTILCE